MRLKILFNNKNTQLFQYDVSVDAMLERHFLEWRQVTWSVLALTQLLQSHTDNSIQQFNFTALIPSLC